MTQVDVMEGVVVDWRSKWTSMCYNQEFDSLKGAYLASYLPSVLDQLERHFEGKKWIIGEQVRRFFFSSLSLLPSLPPSLLN